MLVHTHGRLSYRWPHWVFFFPRERGHSLQRRAHDCPHIGTLLLSLAVLRAWCVSDERRAVDRGRARNGKLSTRCRVLRQFASTLASTGTRHVTGCEAQPFTLTYEKKTDFRTPQRDAVYVTVRRRFPGITQSLCACARVCDNAHLVSIRPYHLQCPLPPLRCPADRLGGTIMPFTRPTNNYYIDDKNNVAQQHRYSVDGGVCNDDSVGTAKG